MDQPAQSSILNNSKLFYGSLGLRHPTESNLNRCIGTHIRPPPLTRSLSITSYPINIPASNTLILTWKQPAKTNIENGPESPAGFEWPQQENNLRNKIERNLRRRNDEEERRLTWTNEVTKNIQRRIRTTMSRTYKFQKRTKRESFNLTLLGK